MNDRTLLALLCGAVVGGALLLLVVAIRGTAPRQVAVAVPQGIEDASIVGSAPASASVCSSWS